MEPSDFKSYEELQSRKKAEKSNCAICKDLGDGYHFGAEACRACAAFFRRTVALGKEYECRQNGFCTVDAIVRSICKACRLNKCLKVGMKQSCVQPRRDTSSRREDEQLSQSESVFSNDINPSTSKIQCDPSFQTMPILEKMKLNYDKLEDSRSIVHRKQGDNIFEKRAPRALNFRTTLEMASNEVSLVADWMEWCFDEFRLLPVDQKSLLFINFIPTFMILERAFLTSKYGEKNQLVLASRDYIPTDRLEEYFTDVEHGIRGEELTKLFLPSLQQNECLHDLLRSENVDLYDFFVYTVLLLWDHGLVGQSEECSAIGRRMKLAITKEYIYYLEHIKGEENPAGLMSVKMSILTCVERVTNRFREDMSLAHIFDAHYTIPTNLYNIIVGKYS